MPKAKHQKSKKVRENRIQVDALSCGTGWDERDLSVMTVTGKTLGDNLEQLEKEGFFRRGEGYLANKI